MTAGDNSIYSGDWNIVNQFTTSTGDSFTTSTDSTAGDQAHNHTLYKEQYTTAPIQGQDWYIYNDSDVHNEKLIRIIDRLWITLKPYIKKSNPDDAEELQDMIDIVLNDSGVHYGHSAWENKKEDKQIEDKELNDLFEI